MQDDIHELAKRANIAAANEPGFVECFVESVSPSVLGYRFTSTIEAHAYQMRQALIDVHSEIPQDRQNIVLVRK